MTGMDGLDGFFHTGLQHSVLQPVHNGAIASTLIYFLFVLFQLMHNFARCNLNF